MKKLQNSRENLQAETSDDGTFNHAKIKASSMVSFMMVTGMGLFKCESYKASLIYHIMLILYLSRNLKFGKCTIVTCSIIITNHVIREEVRLNQHS